MGKLLGGILLVAGTTIGAGMLALPIVTGFSGFFPSMVLFLFFFALMTYTALLMLEVNLTLAKPGANMISMAEATLGPFGKAVVWGIYLFLLYALTTAYLAGGGPILNGFIEGVFGVKLGAAFGPLPLLLIFGFFVYRGAHSVDFINRYLMLLLVLSYFTIVFFLLPEVQWEPLTYVNLSAVSLGVSIVATSFGFHIVIPTLTTYFERDVKKIRASILIGSLIPLITYLLWEAICLGIIPIEGPISLTSGFQAGSNGADLLSDYLGNGVISEIARVFSLLAIVTSFLGVSTSLTDFLADGFNIEKTRGGKLFLILLTFTPPLLIALIDPRAFLTALDYAGAFGVVLLLALIPGLMALSSRRRGIKSAYQAPGGKWALILSIVISSGLIFIEILEKLGVIRGGI